MLESIGMLERLCSRRWVHFLTGFNKGILNFRPQRAFNVSDAKLGGEFPKGQVWRVPQELGLPGRLFLELTYWRVINPRRLNFKI